MKVKEVCAKAIVIWKKNRLVLSSALVLALLVPAVLWTVGGQSPSQTQELLILMDDGLIAQGVNIGSQDVSGLDADGAMLLLEEQQPQEPDEMGQGETGQEDTDQEDTDQEDTDQEDTDQEESLQEESTPEQTMLVLVLPDRQIQIPMAELPVTPRIEVAVNNAMRIGRIGGIQARLQDVENAKQSGTAVYVPYTYEQEALQEAVLAIAADIPRESVQGSFIFDPSLEERFVVVKSIQGFTPDDQALIASVEVAFSSGKIHEVEVPGTVSGDPIDENTAESVMENITLVGKFTTKVGGSSNRVSNIKTGAALINGTVVQPEEIFSTNECLGPRTKAAGIWKMAPAIASGRIIQGLGGGICQISSTLFNAVGRADFEIVEWRHHSIPSSYVPIGCDATISTNGPDFRFKNNTQWPVYIVYYYEEDTRKLTCELWGRPLPDGQYIEIIGKQVGTKPMPGAVTTTDPEMVFSGRNGKYSRTYKVWYTADGTEISRELIDKTTYPAKAPVVLATPTPDPSGGTTPIPGDPTATPDGGTPTTTP